ncbi:MAG: PaaI family thioesterase [Chloroflexi bacterium]|nr:PaaI family thioesterase [Chloroflexota bacterium]
MSVKKQAPQGETRTPQPNSRKCFVCGIANPIGLKIRFLNTGPGSIEARLTLTEYYQSYPGIAHGGIVATILDETMGRSILSVDEGRLMYTGKMELRYRHPVPLDTEILFRGWIVKDRQRIAQVAGEAVLPDGTVAVEATSTVVMIPSEELASMNTDDVGWRVYEDHEFD